MAQKTVEHTILVSGVEHLIIVAYTVISCLLVFITTGYPERQSDSRAQYSIMGFAPKTTAARIEELFLAKESAVNEAQVVFSSGIVKLVTQSPVENTLGGSREGEACRCQNCVVHLIDTDINRTQDCN